MRPLVVAALVGVPLFVAAAHALRADPAPGRSRWEYRVQALPAGTTDADLPAVLDAALAKATAEGWEWAGSVDGRPAYVLRRAR